MVVVYCNVVCRGGDKLEFTPASSQLLFTPVSVEVVVDSGRLVLSFACISRICTAFIVQLLFLLLPLTHIASCTYCTYCTFICRLMQSRKCAVWMMISVHFSTFYLFINFSLFAHPLAVGWAAGRASSL